MMGITDAQRQKNFTERVSQIDAFLQNSIEELEIDVRNEPKGVYAQGEEYECYSDLAEIIGKAKNEVFLLDPYLDEEHFNFYVGRIKGRR